MLLQPNSIPVPKATRSHGDRSECGFTLQAVPRDRQVGERCGTVDIDQAGVKTAVVGGCW